MVLIMGLGGTAEHWPPQVIEALAKNHQLILMDNRGMGHTTANDTTFSYPLFAADVIGLLDALGVKRSDVLGYSMGSTITQQLLLQYPDRFNKALIHATSTDGSSVAKALHGRVPADPIVARQVEATTHWKTPLDKLPSIANQVMLVVGTADNVVGTDSSKTLATAIPGAWLVQFKGATHHLMYETPQGFSAAALTFFDTDETVTVKAQPDDPRQSCTVAHATGVVKGDVSNIAVTCAGNNFLPTGSLAQGGRHAVEVTEDAILIAFGEPEPRADGGRDAWRRRRGDLRARTVRASILGRGGRELHFPRDVLRQ